MELSVSIIKRRSGHYDLELVALLDVSRLKIFRLAQLEHCVNLQELNLAHNELPSLKGMPALPLLRCLHLSNNQLASLDSLPFLPLLEELTVANNQVQSINFDELATKLPSLRAIDFTGNVLESSSVKAKASEVFPSLLFLNGEALTLTKLFIALTSSDVEIEDGDNLAVSCTDCEDEVDPPKDKKIEFITNITSHLEESLRRCNLTLEKTEPELIFPGSSSFKSL